MIWVLIVNAILLAVLSWEVSAQGSFASKLIIRSSDLNLERQATIIDLLEQIERHLDQVPKIRRDWEA